MSTRTLAGLKILNFGHQELWKLPISTITHLPASWRHSPFDVKISLGIFGVPCRFCFLFSGPEKPSRIDDVP